MRTSPPLPAAPACALQRVYTPCMDASAPYPGLPAPNLLSHPVLLGLCRRALSPGADPAQGALTARRIDHARLAQTELLKRISALKADTGITQDKALRLSHSAQQAQLDLRLFEERHPPPPSGKGLFKPKLSLEQHETEQQRSRLGALARQAQQDAEQASANAQAVSRELLLAESELKAMRAERGGYELELRDQVGAWITAQLAAGEGAAARRTLADLRRNVRGDAIVGALVVLTELFDAGPQAARQALADCTPIFEQHRDPAARVLEQWIVLYAAGAAADPAQAMPAARLHESGLYLREQFTQPGLYRLYGLARILGGLGYDATPVAADPLRDTYAAVEGFISGTVPEPRGQPPDDVFLRLLLAGSLLCAGRCEEVLDLAGFDAAHWQPPKRKRETVPVLWECVTALEFPAWPQPLQAGVQAALAMHILLAAHAAGPEQLAAAWLSESYGWPKDDFFWWGLSTLQRDPGLQRNITAEPGQLFRVPHW